MPEYARRNYVLMFIDPIFFVSGMTFLSANTVVTYFLNRLGASAFDISLANALVAIGAVVSQPVFARQAAHHPHKLKSFVRILFTQRLFLLLAVLLIPWVVRLDAQAAVWLFIACWGVFNLFTGAYAPFYMSLFARMIANQQRGRLRGFSGAVGNLVALLATWVIAFTLKAAPYPYDYTLLFAIGASLLLVDVGVYALMREPQTETVGRSADFRYLRDLPALLRADRPFAWMVAGFSSMVIAQAGVMYIILFAIRIHHANAGDIALFTAVMVAVNVVGSIILGIFGDRFGHALVLRISAACAVLSGMLPLFVHDLAGLYIAFALGNLGMNGYNLSSGVLIIEHSQPADIAMKTSVSVVVTLAGASLFTLFGSLLIPYISYYGLFIIIVVAGAFSYIPFHKRAKTRAVAG